MLLLLLLPPVLLLLLLKSLPLKLSQLRYMQLSFTLLLLSLIHI